MLKFLGTVKTGTKDFLNDECMVSGAALAYYTVFSLPPLLVLVFFLAGMVGFSDQQISDAVSRQIGIPVPGRTESTQASEQPATTDDASGLQNVAERRSSETSSIQALGPVSKIIGIGLLVFSATGVFVQLQRALNRAWEVEPDPEQGGMKNFIVKRALSLGMIATIAFLLLVSLVLTTVVDEIVHAIMGGSAGPAATTVGIIVNNLVALAMATVLFAAMFKILPDAKMRWKDMWVGAFLTGFLFVAGKAAIGWYLQNSQIGSAWGSAASSMIALLVWVYYSSIIVLYGAELTQAWADRHGRGIAPDKHAVRVVQEKRPVREKQITGPAT